MNQSSVKKSFSRIKLLPLTILVLVASCTSDKDSEIEDSYDDPIETTIDTNSIQTEVLVDSNTVEDSYSSASIFTEGVGWGYQILLNNKPYISQPHIPAVSGVKGFETEEDALKTAELGIYKMENGLFPPTISEEELDSLGVLH